MPEAEDRDRFGKRSSREVIVPATDLLLHYQVGPGFSSENSADLV